MCLRTRNLGCYRRWQDPGQGCRCLEDRGEDDCLNSCQDRCNQLGRAVGWGSGTGSGSQADREDTQSGRATPGTSLRGNFKQRQFLQKRMKDFVPKAKLSSNHFSFTVGASVTVGFTFPPSLIPVEASWTGCGDAAAPDTVVTSWTNVPGCSLHWSSGLRSLQAVETYEETCFQKDSIKWRKTSSLLNYLIDW